MPARIASAATFARILEGAEQRERRRHHARHRAEADDGADQREADEPPDRQEVPPPPRRPLLAEVAVRGDVGERPGKAGQDGRARARPAQPRDEPREPEGEPDQREGRDREEERLEEVLGEQVGELRRAPGRERRGGERDRREEDDREQEQERQRRRRGDHPPEERRHRIVPDRLAAQRAEDGAGPGSPRAAARALAAVVALPDGGIGDEAGAEAPLRAQHLRARERRRLRRPLADHRTGAALEALLEVGPAPGHHPLEERDIGFDQHRVGHHEFLMACGLRPTAYGFRTAPGPTARRSPQLTTPNSQLTTHNSQLTTHNS